ncbi:hypothetical protein FHR53_000961 [Xanthomonas arboricola]
MGLPHRADALLHGLGCQSSAPCNLPDLFLAGGPLHVAAQQLLAPATQGRLHVAAPVGIGWHRRRISASRNRPARRPGRCSARRDGRGRHAACCQPQARRLARSGSSLHLAPDSADRYVAVSASGVGYAPLPRHKPVGTTGPRTASAAGMWLDRSKARGTPSTMLCRTMSNGTERHRDFTRYLHFDVSANTSPVRCCGLDND